MTYQWYKDGNPILGATAATYSIPHVGLSDQGSYYVKITNAGGTTQSVTATLTVLSPPSITAQPISQTVAESQPVSFSVQAIANPAPTYQWTFNGAPLGGATNSALTLPSAQSANAGRYIVVVSNAYGSVTSVVATLLIQSWVARYDGTADNNDFVQAVAVDRAGNVYETGYAKESDSGSLDYVTLKYDPSGKLLWRAVYDSGSGRADQAAALVVDDSGNVYVTGSSQLNYGWDFVTVKYDSSGNQLWASRFNGANRDDLASAIAVDGKGNVLVTGKSKNAADKFQYATVKYDNAGNQVWVQTYAGPSATEDDANSLAVDTDGNVYVTGQSKGVGSDFDYATIKYSPDGAQLWVARYNGPSNSVDQASRVVVDSAKNVYVTGASTGSGTNFDYATLKYSPAGVQLWVARYNGPSNGIDKATDLALDANGNVFVTGSSELSPGKSDYATIKYSPDGVQLWAQRYDGASAGDDDANALALDANGDVYVTGQSKGSGTGYDFATVKYLGADGTQAWVTRFNSGGGVNDTAVALALDTQFNVYVAGQAFNNLDYTLIKYSPGMMAPQITSQPQSQSVVMGQQASFAVQAWGTAPLSYQWTFNGTPIAGATNSFLSLNRVRMNDYGTIMVVVSNAAGSVISAPATLTVLSIVVTPPTITSPALDSSGFSFQFSVPQGLTYVVLASSDLVTWAPIATNFALANTVLFTDPTASNFPSRFYRIALQ